MRAEQEKREQEEYLAMKEAFVVEDEGEGAADESEVSHLPWFIVELFKLLVLDFNLWTVILSVMFS